MSTGAQNVQGELSRATLNRARKNRPQWLALLAALRLESQ